MKNTSPLHYITLITLLQWRRNPGTRGIVALLLAVLSVFISGISAPSAAMTWNSSTPMPSVGYQYDPVEYAGRVYVVGGYNASGVFYSNSWFASVNPDGSLVAWTATTPLPEPDQGPGVTAYSGHLYVACGNGNMYRAPVNPDGSLGTWQALPVAQANHGGRMSLRAHNGYLYVLGGFHYSAFYSEVYVAKINSDGSIAAWTATTPMPQGRQHQSVLFENERIYIVGGIGSGNTILDTTYSAAVNPDGTLGNWRQETTLPTPLWYHHSVLVNNEIYLFGGNSNYTTGFYTNILRCSLNEADGSLGGWSVVGNMPSAFVAGVGTTYSSASGHLYLLSGDDGVTRVTNQVWSTRLPMSWKPTSAMPLVGYQYDPVEYAGRVYVVGGYSASGVFFSNSWFAAINADGSLGAWTPATPLPEADQGPGVTAYNGHLFVACGNGHIYQAAINPNGSLGNWQQLTTAQVNHGGRMSLRAYNGYLYLLGGFDGSFYPEVYVALINIDGSISGWTATTPMPQSRQHQSVLFQNNRIYIVGGIGSGNTILNTAYSAPVNPNGTLGSWRAETSLPSPIWYHHSVLVNNEIYLFGGLSGYSGDPMTTVLRCRVNEGDGSLTSWFVAGSMPSAFVAGAGTVFSPSSGNLYLFSGDDGVTRVTNQVWRTLLVEPATITVDLKSQTASLGGTASLFVHVSGRGPINYQWQFNGADIPGATGATLNLNGLNAAQAGSYRVVVCNAAGCTTSTTSTLSILDAKMYAGLMIAGPVGSTYCVEYANALGGTNTWKTLTTFALPSSPYYFFDMASPQHPQRFYRAILQQ